MKLFNKLAKKKLRLIDEPYLTNMIHLNLQEKMLIIMDIMKFNLDNQSTDE